jgi:hypothetical protein
MEGQSERGPCVFCRRLEAETRRADLLKQRISQALAAASTEGERELALTAMARERRHRMQLLGQMRDHQADCGSPFRLPLRNEMIHKEVTVVCMYCKRVQSDRGGMKQWEPAEGLPEPSGYLSHGICGACFRKHMPARDQDGLQQTNS